MLSEELLNEITGEVQNAVQIAAEAAVRAAIVRLLENKAGELTAIIEQVDVGRMVYEQMRLSVANEIGNRLRCGVWNGQEITKLVEECWPAAVDEAVKDRIRWRLGTMVEDEIKSRLANLLRS